MTATSLSGVFAASLTPMRPDLSIDHDRLVSHSKWLLKNGCNGLAFMGTTGEANSFSVNERTQALDTLMNAGIPARSLLVGTGCCALPDTLSLTRHALDHGAYNILLLPPFYYKGVSDEGIFAAIDAVIQHIADNRLRIYLYHFPYMSQVPFSDGVIEKLISAYPSIIAGIKDSSGDWDHIRHLIKTFPDLNIFAGTERYLLETLKAGGAGCISASANITAPLAAEVYQHVNSDKGEELQKTLTSDRLTLQSKPMIPALKGVMARLKGNSEWTSLRPPLLPLPESEIEHLFAELATIKSYHASQM